MIAFQRSILGGLVVALLGAAPVEAEEISDVQGAGHRSPIEGETVEVTGIVTLLQTRGFFLQSPQPSDPSASDSIFVFTSTKPDVSVGDRVNVEGRVGEFTPPNRPKQLPLTQIADPEVTILSHGERLPDAVVIGPGGRMPPTEVIDDDGLTTYEPQTDGIDFYELLEGMRVVVEEAIALSTLTHFGEVWVLSAGGRGATGFNGSDAIVMHEGDLNPERILLDLDLVEVPEDLEAGKPIETLTGVLDYAFGNFRVQVTRLGRDPAREAEGILTVASYNVENLDPKIEDRSNVDGDADVDDDAGDGKFDAIARQIVVNLGAPAIVALQEVQDNDGAEQTSTVAADLTLQTLVTAIEAAGGPTYAFLDLPPEDDAEGGQPGGNIRVAYLFDPVRAELTPQSARRVVDPDLSDGDAFERTRRPLLATFETAVGPVTIINVHLSSRGGSDPAFGVEQPPAIGSSGKRRAQSAMIADEVDQLLAVDQSAQVVVLGDFNAFYFEPELTGLEGNGRLVNLHRTLPETARYTYVFDGQAQALDHTLVSEALSGGAELRIFRLNAGKLGGASDHDPMVATFGVDANQ